MKHVVKVILLLLNLLWGLLLVIGSYSAYFPSRIGTLVELLFPLNLFACIAFFFIWLAYNPRYIWVPLAALVISWGGIARYCPVHKPQPIDNSQPGFSLMTYNAYFFLDYEGTDTRQNRTLSFILSQNADLVCLQESPGLIAPNPGLKITGEQIDSIHTLYPYRIPTTRYELPVEIPSDIVVRYGIFRVERHRHLPSKDRRPYSHRCQPTHGIYRIDSNRQRTIS